MDTINLNGWWKVQPAPFSCKGESGYKEIIQNNEAWIPAYVPGEIHLDLMRAGQMPDPSVGMNMPDCRWPETRSWWFRTLLDIDADFVKNERQELIFEGLDLFAQVFINGKLLGEATNAFVPASFNVKRFLLVGENELVVRLTAGSELVKDVNPAGLKKNGIVNSDTLGLQDRKWDQKNGFPPIRKPLAF